MYCLVLTKGHYRNGISPPSSPLCSTSDSSSYLPHISDSSLLPPLKAKLNGTASGHAAATAGGGLFGGVIVTAAASSNGLNGGGPGNSNSLLLDNCDTMSLNGGSSSLVSSNGGGSNGVMNSINGGGHVSNGGSNGVHVNGMATLPLVRPNTGESSSRTSTLDSPSHEGSLQNGKGKDR